MKTSQPSACTSTGTCAAYCTASTQHSAPASCASSETRATSTIVPTAFDEPTHATTRTRSSSSVREVVVVEAQILGHVHPLDLEAAVGGELDPRRDAAVVVEARDEDPVALVPVARGGAREREVEPRHVGAEDHVVGRAVEEAAGVLARRGEDPLHALARLVVRADVRARLAQRARDRVADLVRHLRAAGRVEEDEAAVAQRGEAPADRLDVQ